VGIAPYKARNEEPSDLYALPNIIKTVKQRRRGWGRHVARIGENRNIDRILVENPEEK
jgi:hypothetical protein